MQEFRVELCLILQCTVYTNLDFFWHKKMIEVYDKDLLHIFISNFAKFYINQKKWHYFFGTDCQNNFTCAKLSDYAKQSSF